MSDADQFDDLAAKTLAGEASDQEKTDFRHLLDRNPAFRAEFDELERLYAILREAGPEMALASDAFEVPHEQLNSLRDIVQATWNREKASIWSHIRDFILRSRVEFAACGIVGILIILGICVFIGGQKLSITVSDPLIQGIDSKGQLVLRKNVRLPDDLKGEVRTKLMTGQILAILQDPTWTMLQRNVIASNIVTLGARNANSREFKLDFPVDTVIRPQPLVFRWQEVPGAQRYEVSIQRRGDNEPIRKETKVTIFKWTDPALASGVDYEWEVTAVKLEGQTEVSGRVWFSVLPAEKLRELVELESSYQESPVVLAAIYQRYGLKQDLKNAQKRILEANPQLRKVPGNQER